jgi:Flp pilus assembly protein TadD
MHPRTVLTASGFGLLAIACASSVGYRGREGPGVTSLQPVDEAPGEPAYSRTTEAAEALAAHKYEKVLALTDSPSKAPTGAWLDYDRGSAFTGLGRTDEAVETFRRAELRFAQTGNDAGRSASMFGRARALDEAGRCSEARSAYQEFQNFVRLSDPLAAEMAASYAGMCRPVLVLH